jgi:hypothetical protein
VPHTYDPANAQQIPHLGKMPVVGVAMQYCLLFLAEITDIPRLLSDFIILPEGLPPYTTLSIQVPVMSGRSIWLGQDENVSHIYGDPNLGWQVIYGDTLDLAITSGIEFWAVTAPDPTNPPPDPQTDPPTPSATVFCPIWAIR